METESSSSSRGRALPSAHVASQNSVFVSCTLQRIPFWGLASQKKGRDKRGRARASSPSRKSHSSLKSRALWRVRPWVTLASGTTPSGPPWATRPRRMLWARCARSGLSGPPQRVTCAGSGAGAQNTEPSESVIHPDAEEEGTPGELSKWGREPWARRRKVPHHPLRQRRNLADRFLEAALRHRHVGRGQNGLQLRVQAVNHDHLPRPVREPTAVPSGVRVQVIRGRGHEGWPLRAQVEEERRL